MQKVFIAMFISFISSAFFTSANAGELYRCVDLDGNIIITDSPQSGMKDCSLKESSDDSSPEGAQQQNKSNKSRQKFQRGKSETEGEYESTPEEKEEAALIREGNKCYTQALKVISGGSVSGIYYWRICRDKNGKEVSRRRLNYKY